LKKKHNHPVFGAFSSTEFPGILKKISQPCHRV